METYATQQTADLTTQLAKANSDKEKLVELVKEFKKQREARALHGNKAQRQWAESNLKWINKTLQDCGITL
jgi:hypothetical protein